MAHLKGEIPEALGIEFGDGKAIDLKNSVPSEIF